MPAKSKPGNCWSRRSTAGKLGIVAIFAVALALGLGLGVGFGVGMPSREKNGDHRTGKPRPTQTSGAPPAATTISGPPSGKNIWQPAVATKWQIVLPNAINIDATATNTTPPDALIWDIDLFLNSKDTIQTLHRLGKKVICYFSAGSFEDWRPDAGQFLDSDKGKTMKGWPNEKWLNLNSDNVRSIMISRLKMAKDKGCDGVDPDNTDAYVGTIFPSGTY
jgi:Glycoside-hydrolase family GH114